MIDQVIARVNSAIQAPAVARLMSACVAASIALVFVIAALVEPDPAGHGTHLRLGLGECTFLQASGWPCPMCGATTSFALMAHLRPIDSVINQPFAAFLFVLSAGILGVSTAEALDPRNRWTRIFKAIEPVETVLAVLFLSAMALGWAYKAWTWPGA